MYKYMTIHISCDHTITVQNTKLHSLQDYIESCVYKCLLTQNNYYILVSKNPIFWIRV